MLCASLTLTSPKTRWELLFQVFFLLGGSGDVLKCFLSLCAPRVTRSTTDGEQDKCPGDWSLFFLPTPLRSWHWHSHWHMWYVQPPVSLCFLLILCSLAFGAPLLILSVLRTLNTTKKKKLTNVKFRGGQRLAHGKVGFRSSSEFRRRVSKEKYNWREQLWGIFLSAPRVFSEGSE